MKTRSASGSLLFGIFLAVVARSAFSHDPSKSDQPYRQTDLVELHAIVETLRANSGPAQLAKIDQLETDAAPELQRLSQRAIAAHRRKVELMLEEVVNRHTFEEAQANELAAANALSKSIDAALTNLAKTLTPEQRSHFREHNKPSQD